MRANWAPATPAFWLRVEGRESRETQLVRGSSQLPLDSGLSALDLISDQGEIRTPMPLSARRSERRVSTVPPPGRDFFLDWALKELNLSSPPHLFSDNGFTDRREEQSPLSSESRDQSPA